MAEDIRDEHTKVHIEESDLRRLELIAECERQFESCLYTATGLYEWQKRAKTWRAVFVVAPIILGGLASSQIITGFDAVWAKFIAAGLSLLAGFFPAIYEALGMDMRVSEIGQAAAEFTSLRDRFRQAAKIRSHGSFEEFNALFEPLMDRMDAARKTSPPLPEKWFKVAQEKIKKGNYDFAVDQTPGAGG